MRLDKDEIFKYLREIKNFHKDVAEAKAEQIVRYGFWEKREFLETLPESVRNKILGKPEKSKIQTAINNNISFDTSDDIKKYTGKDHAGAGVLLWFLWAVLTFGIAAIGGLKAGGIMGIILFILMIFAFQEIEKK